MKYLTTAEEMKYCDTQTIEYFQVPSLVLMERAACGVAQEVFKSMGGHGKILVLSGTGNNGGDAVAAGRILYEDHPDLEIDIVVLGKQDKYSEELRSQLSIASAYGLPILIVEKEEEWGEQITNLPLKEYDSIIDGILGIGLQRNLEGLYDTVVEYVAKNKASHTKTIAVDIPTGISSDTGKIMGRGLKADVTVTFGFAKRGQYLHPGTGYCGQTVVKAMGITKKSFRSRQPSMCVVDEEDMHFLPKRISQGNKGSFGKVLLAAGNRNMCGACILAGKSLMATGIGMLSVHTSLENYQTLQMLMPECILGNSREDLEERIQWADVVVAGPGIGRDAYSEWLVDTLLSECMKPLVLDADAIWQISVNEERKALLKERGRKGLITVLTPHMGEFATFLGLPVSEIVEDAAAYVQNTAREYGMVVVCKDARTMIGRSEKGSFPALCLNVNGNSGMATAGSGDVLSGIIGGLLCRTYMAWEAGRTGQKLIKEEDIIAGICLGVYLHGAAGDRAAHEKGANAMTAGDMIEQIRYVYDA